MISASSCCSSHEKTEHICSSRVRKSCSWTQFFPFFRIIVSGRLPTPTTLSFGTDAHLKEIKFFKMIFFFQCCSSEKVAGCNSAFEIITYKRHRHKELAHKLSDSLLYEIIHMHTSMQHCYTCLDDIISYYNSQKFFSIGYYTILRNWDHCISQSFDFKDSSGAVGSAASSQLAKFNSVLLLANLLISFNNSNLSSQLNNHDNINKPVIIS